MSRLIPESFSPLEQHYFLIDTSLHYIHLFMKILLLTYVWISSFYPSPHSVVQFNCLWCHLSNNYRWAPITLLVSRLFLISDSTSGQMVWQVSSLILPRQGEKWFIPSGREAADISISVCWVSWQIVDKIILLLPILLYIGA